MFNLIDTALLSYDNSFIYMNGLDSFLLMELKDQTA